MVKNFSKKQESSTKPIVEENDILEIIEKTNNEKLNNIAKKLGEYYASGSEKNKLSSAQIRNILDRIQRMKGYDKNQLQLLRPLLAYAAGRDQTPEKKLKHLQEIIDRAIMKVDNEEKFKNLRNFFEAIVAYHRYYGGK